MDQTHAPRTATSSEQKNAGVSVVGSGLKVSSPALNFDRTELGEESFLTLKITPPYANALVVLSIADAQLFQIAAGVERLAFKEVLTIKPEPTGSYIHLRYTPERSGRHKSVLTVEAPATAETINVSLTGRAGGMARLGKPVVHRLPAAEPIVRRSNRTLLASLLIGGLAIGAGYGVYTYRCQIWPDACGPSFGTTVATDKVEEPVELTPTLPPVKPSISRNKPKPRINVPEAEAPVKAKAVAIRPKPQADVPEVIATTKSKPASEAPKQTAALKRDKTANVASQPAAIASQAAPEVETRKIVTKPKSTQRTQPVSFSPMAAPKPKPSEESELERVLNNGTNQ